MSNSKKTPATRDRHAIALYIPTPCHENWDAMTPVQQGRFCQSCAKEVVDFSLMTDQEVLNYFSKSTGNTCGRFNNDQLQRPLQPTKIEKKKAWWVVAMMPLMMLFEKAGAQRKSVTTVKSAIIIQEPVKGDTVTNIKRKIYGSITNTRGMPVPFADISVNNKLQGVNADSAGKFELLINADFYSAQIEVSSVGYDNEKFFINDSDQYTIVLKESKNILPTVEVVGYGTTKGRYTTGTYGVCHTSYAKKDTFLSFMSPVFTIYPSPAPRGSMVNIRIKSEGTYTIQLYDNSGKLISVNTFNAAKGIKQTAINIPATLSAGMYYIHLVDERAKKRYADKLIVM